MSSGQSAFAKVNNPGAIESPCVGVCTLGPGDICIGCLRTSSEIGNWTMLSSEQRNRVISELPQRLETLFAR